MVAKNKPLEVPGCRINLYDPERFPKLREAFIRRGLGHLQLSSMLRIVLDEWAAAQNSAKPPAP